MRSAVTVSRVEQARGGPFVLWDELPEAAAKAGRLGFDAIEIFPPGPEAIDAAGLKPMLAAAGVGVAAVGTGAGWVVKKLHLVSRDEAVRRAAEAFIGSMIDVAAEFGAPAIIGSMQGRSSPQVADGLGREEAMARLGEALGRLGERAAARGTVLLYEPLNRYETNLVNTLEQGVELLGSLRLRGVKLLADLFHMNIEEQDPAGALRRAGAWVGHVHLADSNRRAAGCGHTDFAPVAGALEAIGYAGYLSAEVLAWPGPDEAARLAIEGYRRFRAGWPAA